MLEDDSEQRGPMTALSSFARWTRDLKRCLGGEQDHRHRVLPLPELAQEAQTVPAGQHDVEHDGGEGSGDRVAQPLVAVAADLDGETLLLQSPADALACGQGSVGWGLPHHAGRRPAKLAGREE